MRLGFSRFFNGAERGGRILEGRRDSFVVIWQLSPTRFSASKMTRDVAIMAHQRVFLVISAVTYHAWPIVMNGHILHSISMLHRHEVPTL